MQHERCPLQLAQASDIILRNASNVTLGPAYAFGENNRRTFILWKGWGRMPGGKKPRSLWSLTWESHLHSRSD